MVDNTVMRCILHIVHYVAALVVLAHDAPQDIYWCRFMLMHFMTRNALQECEAIHCCRGGP